MLSSLPKLADKAFVIGFFLPTILFAVALLGLFYDLQSAREMLTASADSSKLEKLVFLVLAVWTLAVLMMVLNTHQYRILEGYIGPFAWAKDHLVKHERKRFDRLKYRVDELNARRRADGSPLTPAEHRELVNKWVDLVRLYPRDRNALLPTRFGNAILAFEQYSKNVYRADAVTLWPHLASVFSKEVQASLDSARAQVDALVNIHFFALTIASITFFRVCWIVVRRFYTATPITLDTTLSSRSLFLLAVFLGSLLVARLSFKLATQKAYAWGDGVKAAFDCYLPELAKKLGFMLPPTGQAQGELWAAISTRAALHEPFEPGDWPRTDNAPAASPGTAPQMAKPLDKDDAEAKRKVASDHAEEPEEEDEDDKEGQGSR